MFSLTQQLANILKDPEASSNDKFVALELLKNANIASGMILPGCQDTGTAICMGGSSVSLHPSRRTGRWACWLGCLSLSLCLSLCFSLCISLCFSLSTSLSLPLSLSLLFLSPVSLSLSLCLPPPPLSPSVSQSL